MRLLRVELLRLFSRRAVKALTLLALAVIVIIGVQAIFEARRDPGVDDWVFVIRMNEGANIVAGLLSVYAFLVGATYAGADWANGTVQSLLTWEPRRVRVVLAKLVGLGVVVLATGVLLHLSLTAFAAGATDQGGTFAGVDGEFWRRQLLADSRALALGVLIGWLGFGIASLTRNTGAALGAGFVYFAILEQVLRGGLPWTNRYLIGNAIAVWIGGAIQITIGKTSFEFTRPMAATVLVGYVVLVVGLMTTLFTRRDVT